MRLRALIIIGIMVLLTGSPVAAHANLLRSDPPANASLESSPGEIRLWFTEALETAYSRMTLLDSNGEVVAGAPSIIDPDDATQMLLAPGELAEGLYTVSWRVVSAADGHPTEGSFAFGVGVVVGAGETTLNIDESVPADDVLIRWLNLLSLSLLLGSIAFTLFVWRPAFNSATFAMQRLLQIILTGWIAVGMTTLLMLLLQLSVAADSSILAAISIVDLGQFIGASNYGRLWLLRLGLWLLLGLLLWWQAEKRLRLALVLVAGMLLTQSLFSHASATSDALAGIAADWLHLLSSTLWLGGLAAFFLSLRLLRDCTPSPASRLTAYFSNYSRVAVVLLIITGSYAAWLQVGSLEALLNTVFGQALLVKLILFLPLLLTAGFNLLVTQRKLAAGGMIWTRTLRALIATEITLLVAVMAVVGVMTSGAPGRSIQTQRDALAGIPAQPETSYFGMEIVNNQMVHLQIIPGTVGENTFYVSPYDVNGNPIENASLIRLRFDNLDQNLGQSELRPVYDAASEAYVATGRNLSVPGDWRIRMTIQRSGEFDTVVDFETSVEAAAVTPPLVVDTTIPRLSRIVAIGLTGVLLIGASELFLLLRTKHHVGVTVLAACGMIVGIVFALSAASIFSRAGSLTVNDAWMRPTGEGMTAAVYLTLRNGSGQDERLISASTDLATSVEFHETQVVDNIARMIQQEVLLIPAGQSFTFAPGGYHLMLLDLQRELETGDSFPLKLVLASGKAITVDVAVDADR